MRSILSFVLFAIILFSCGRKEKRADVLSQNKMREVMWDMIRTDQWVSDLLIKDSSKNKKEESIKLYEEVFHIHGITKDEFKKSLDYYSSRPDLFRPIIDSLAKRKNDFVPTNTHSIRDSIMKQRVRQRERKQ
jgi:Domain of unknown function (DUF4296)